MLAGIPYEDARVLVAEQLLQERGWNRIRRWNTHLRTLRKAAQAGRVRLCPDWSRSMHPWVCGDDGVWLVLSARTASMCGHWVVVARSGTTLTLHDPALPEALSSGIRDSAFGASIQSQLACRAWLGTDDACLLAPW